MSTPGRPEASDGVGGKPVRLDLADLVGPFYDHNDLRRWLGLTETECSERVAASTLLALTCGDGSVVYPAFQFRTGGDLVEHLPEVLQILATGISDPWTWALWCCAPDDDLAGMSSAGWLAAGHDPEPVLAEARADAARWAS